MELTPEILQRKFEKAKSQRGHWESHWQDCYDYALPRRDGAIQNQTAGEMKRQHLFDGTAPDAVEQLASSIMAELTPAWSSWFQLIPGSEVTDESQSSVEKALQQLSQTIQGQFDRSNFIVELHQCYLDLVTAGTACLLFEEAPLGETSAFKFTAIPLGEVVMEEGARGRLDIIYRKSVLNEAQLVSRFPKASLPESLAMDDQDFDQKKFQVLEAVHPNKHGRYDYMAILTGETEGDEQPMVLTKGSFESSPFITFRWIKAPGEIYGRSPVMKALPDIKTANKIVELMLKNASIAVTGIWQADDDGVLNPATIKLTPGTVIPKAVGSKGLQPLTTASDINLSEALLEKIRAQISLALYRDQLGQPMAQGMSATEFVERTESATRNLSAIFGRLHGELIIPLADRALAILRRRGDIGDIMIDGREINLQINAPLAMRQRMQKAKPIIRWLDMIKQASPDAVGLLKSNDIGRYLADLLGVPETFLHPEENQPSAAHQNVNQATDRMNSENAINEQDLTSIDPKQLMQQLPPDMQNMAQQMAQDVADGKLNLSQVQSRFSEMANSPQIEG
ncbi:portal protein [Curvivirga aplysinae]|uniref:portal protein n=1 Tax=Curvivirga aplysinae TaxID=2529852 RepID=UPI0012BBCC13|nr:portal protein [Curvivirga aplysinae]MTI10736.1 phage tail protein [Curvivirga aplysinae]